jgi:hypothetical protein
MQPATEPMQFTGTQATDRDACVPTRPQDAAQEGPECPRLPRHGFLFRGMLAAGLSSLRYLADAQ